VKALKKLYQLVQVKNGYSKEPKYLCSSENGSSIKHIFLENILQLEGCGFQKNKSPESQESLTLMIQIEELSGMVTIEELSTLYR